VHVVSVRKYTTAYWRTCTECAKKHSVAGAPARKMRLWDEKPVHILIRSWEENFEWNSLISVLNLAFFR
jgi:hypothetical protein